MLKKTITYTDYNNVERTEDFYFHLSKAEVAKMELGVAGGLTEMITRIVNEKNGPEILKIFEELILKSYGIKHADGKRFEKSEEISTAFSQTEAYSNLFMELGTNAEKAVEFFSAIIPKEA